jgi:hypothetical protein
MQVFSGWQYLLIDLANAFGLDKMLFNERIEWAERSLLMLESLVDSAENKPLFIKAMMAIRRAQKGEPIGHLVGMDACCSGIQIMSALTGCVVGATNTGLVDPNVRADAYTTCTTEMNTILGGGFTVSRGDAKDALMTSFYGSKKKPKEIFGEDTPELNAFYQAAFKVAPGAWELLQDLLGSWQPFALQHCWKLPDGFDARVKVMEKQETRIEVDELDHATFTYEYYENVGSKSGLSNVANVVHSVDAYVLRCIHRRCNYDQDMVTKVMHFLRSELDRRIMHQFGPEPLHLGTQLAYYVEQFNRSDMVDVVILPYITQTNVDQLSDDHLLSLYDTVVAMLRYNPFEVITVHDEFKCHPNNMNHLRQQYINIFAELADSNLLSDILSQIHGVPGTATKLSTNLSQLIRGSNYALS